MNPSIREFSIAEKGKVEHFALFYDADVINDKLAEEIIRTHGFNATNDVFKPSSPCFFLPKAQADLLRSSWVPHKINNTLNNIINDISKLQDKVTIDECVSIINTYKKEI